MSLDYPPFRAFHAFSDVASSTDAASTNSCGGLTATPFPPGSASSSASNRRRSSVLKYAPRDFPIIGTPWQLSVSTAATTTPTSAVTSASAAARLVEGNVTPSSSVATPPAYESLAVPFPPFQHSTRRLSQQLASSKRMSIINEARVQFRGRLAASEAAAVGAAVVRIQKFFRDTRQRRLRREANRLAREAAIRKHIHEHRRRRLREAFHRIVSGQVHRHLRPVAIWRWVRVQSVFRGYLCRVVRLQHIRRVATLITHSAANALRNISAAVRIQAAWRSFHVRHRLVDSLRFLLTRRRHAARVIQRSLRLHFAYVAARRLRSAIGQREATAAAMIQRTWRARCRWVARWLAGRAQRRLVLTSH